MLHFMLVFYHRLKKKKKSVLDFIEKIKYYNYGLEDYMKE